MWNKCAIVMLVWLLSLPCVVDARDDLTPPAGERCGVCGMYVQSYPHWVAVAEFAQDDQVFFDGAKDMFSYYFNLAKYRPGTKREDVTGLWVTEYYTMEKVPAREVFFVAGSEVLGPMGHELVPVRGEEALTRFMADHGGEKILQMQGECLESIDLDPDRP